ncbi:MAG: TerB family tellurite resistance protein [Muribaculaceae bacterium]|nr:TerB family tellurite resistance protein [Muribaculaceae bacterium]
MAAEGHYYLKMKFTGEELAAVLKMAVAMIGADGRSDEKEMEVVREELTRFGTSPQQMLDLTKDAQMMEFERAVGIISKFDIERKKYVSSYLAVIMIADGKIDDKEVALWQLVSLLCGFPEMDLNQAVDFMNSL